MGRAMDQGFPAPAHDHGRCVAGALDAAAKLCADHGSRLTPLRRRVLEAVWQSHAPIGAYEVMAAMAPERGPVAPPTVYRALDFLIAEGLVHRLGSLNAYIGCALPGDAHDGAFLLCTACRRAVELRDAPLEEALADLANRAGFELKTRTVELAGLCQDCRPTHEGTRS